MLRVDAVMLAAEQACNCLPVAAVGRAALLRPVMCVALPFQIYLHHPPQCDISKKGTMDMITGYNLIFISCAHHSTHHQVYGLK